MSSHPSLLFGHVQNRLMIVPNRRNERVIVEGAGRTGIDQNNYSWEIKRVYVC